MDILESNAYLCAMFTRFVTLLAVFAIAVIAPVTSVHAARAGVVPDHAVHFSDMMHSSDASELSCDVEKQCGSTDAGTCEYVCAGMSAFLTVPGEAAPNEYRRAGHFLPSDAIHADRTFGLNEHPPKHRLL
jgi:hypothetical protein